ncbi:hydroxyethylthiazole kinase [Acinetobacter brisouii]|uniref:hydroxyethylthiazole kinase n=1 Tax=Acinetobacter brisouii TaxID=396323 RepID=UPI001250C637|nr:hydroxyethylthiazole kinase [Acinetobacter brisouii]
MLERTLLIEQITDAWQKLQQTAPLVQCMTNQVASNYAANVLLACGASPAMIDNPFEAESFTQISSALSINLGTPTEQQMQAMQISAKTAQTHQKPWVLDPVGYSSILKWRSDMTDTLLKYHPTVIRGNASEISTLAGNQSSSKGVDSTLSSDAVYTQAQNLLQHCDCVAISGASDYILSHESTQVIKINGGSALQPKVTATGCALGALIAAYCSVTSPMLACVAAHVHFAIAGQLAAERAPLIGQFAVAFLDELFSLNAEKIAKYADIELLS